MSASRALLAACLACALAGAGAAKKRKAEAAKEPDAPTGSFELRAALFGAGDVFPVDHRGDEDDVSPALTWSGAPKSTETFVLIADESGGSAVAPTTNWLVYDIPSSVVELREELSGGGASDVARLGMKDDAGTEPIVVDPMEGMMGGMGGMEGYEDPEIADMRRMISGAVDSGFDPSARAKEGRRRDGQTGYKGPTGDGIVSFKLYALKGRLGLPAGASKEEVLAAMKGKILTKTTLTAKAVEG